MVDTRYIKWDTPPVVSTAVFDLFCRVVDFLAADITKPEQLVMSGGDIFDRRTVLRLLHGKRGD